MGLRLLASIGCVCLLLSMFIPAHAGNVTFNGSPYRTFYQSGLIEYGKIDDSYTADLVLYVDSSQYLVLKAIIEEFLRQEPVVKTVYVASGLPSRMLKAWILEQGYIDGKKAARTPDLFITTDHEHLDVLRAKKLAETDTVFAGNQLVLMVARNNPKNIKSIRDLSRNDIVQCHPAPDSSDMFSKHGSKLLMQAGLLTTVADGKTCQDCWITQDHIWFTSDYRNQTPLHIATGKADTGLTWASDIEYANRYRMPVESIRLNHPAIKYHAVGLTKARNTENARRFLRFLLTEDASSIYARYKFTTDNHPSIYSQTEPHSGK